MHKCPGRLLQPTFNLLGKGVKAMLDTVFIGIDVSSQTNVVHVMDQAGNRIWADSFRNSRRGSEQMVSRLTADAALQDAFYCFGLEATGCFGKGLEMFLRETPLIPAKRKAVHVLNPKQVKRFHDAYADLQKDDYIDAFVIADSLRFGRLAIKEAAVEDKYLALQRVTRWRYQTAQELTREKNRYLQNLFLKFSAMAQLQGSQDALFSNTFGATALDFIEDFEDVDQIAYTHVEDLIQYLIDHGKNHFADPQQLAQDIQKAARTSYRLPKAVSDSVNQVLAMQINTIRFYEQQLKEIDKVIERQVQAIPNTLTSIPGIGPVYAAGLLAEIGDVKRFESEAALAKFAGLTWTKHQSGTFQQENTHLIQGGNRFLRYYFCQAANLVRQHDPDYQKYYLSKYRETAKSPHKRALVLTARKLVRLVFVLLRDGTLYKLQTR